MKSRPVEILRAMRAFLRYLNGVSKTRQLNNIALIGFMGTGKSTVGRMLAEQLHFAYLDTDEIIESRAGKSIAAIFAEDGESVFRQLEKKIVTELASRSNTVIATGGGLGANEENLENLRQHAVVICLWASPEKIWDRVRTQSHRPLLREADPLAKIHELLAAREPVYKKADVLLNTELRPLREVVQQAMYHFQSSRRR